MSGGQEGRHHLFRVGLVVCCLLLGGLGIPRHTGTTYAVEGSPAWEQASPRTLSLTALGPHQSSNRDSPGSSLALNGTPDGIVVDSATGDAYVAAGANVSIIRGTTFVTSVRVPGGANGGLAFDPNDQYVYVTTGGNNVVVLNGTTVLTTISVGTYLDGGTWGAAFDPNNGYVYVSYAVSNTVNYVAVIDGLTVTASINVSAYYLEGAQLAFDSLTGDIYVASGYSLLLINGTSLLGSVNTSLFGQFVVFDPENGFVYLTSFYDASGIVSVGKGLSVISTITFASYGIPSGAAYDSANGYIYVTNEGWDNVSVINGTEVITSIPVGPSPVGAAFDPMNGYLYVANSGLPTCWVCSYQPGSVSIINGSSYYPEISSFGATPSPVEINSTTISTTTLNVKATMGVGSSVFTYTGLPPGCTTSDTPALACTPLAPGVYVVKVFANDSVGISAAATTSLDVIAALSVSITATSRATDARVPIVFSAVPLGGIGPYNYSWNLGDGTSSSNQNLSHSFATSGNFSPRVLVKDSWGGSTARSVSVSIDPALAVALTVSSLKPAIGEVLSIHAEASGGAGSYTYAYFGLPPGCVTMESPELSCIPSELGAFNITLTVQDRLGVNVSQELQVTVVRANPSVAASPLVLIGGVVIIGVVTTTLLLFVRRRRKGRGTQTPPATDP